MTIQSWTADELRARLSDYEQQLRDAGKARNTVTTYVQHPERFINWLEGTYTPRTPASSQAQQDGTSSRYAPLRAHLSERREHVVRMTFDEIESLLGAALPESARRYRPWWANERAGSHVHARAWLAAGRKTANVNLTEGRVDFIR